MQANKFNNGKNEENIYFNLSSYCDIQLVVIGSAETPPILKYRLIKRVL